MVGMRMEASKMKTLSEKQVRVSFLCQGNEDGGHKALLNGQIVYIYFKLTLFKMVPSEARPPSVKCGLKLSFGK